MPVKGYRAPRVIVVCDVCGASREILPCQIKNGQGRYCSRHCKYEAQRYQEDHEAEVRRFWSKVDRSGGFEACWPFMPNRARRGYGVVAWRNKDVTPARVAYEIANGVPPEHDACHTCDNPPCCNPAHIFDGTPKENRNDCEAKMRHNYGERNGRHRLTEEEAKAIVARASFRSSSERQEIAREFGISIGHLNDMISGRKWRHLHP